jgi:hypothetical protein
MRKLNYWRGYRDMETLYTTNRTVEKAVKLRNNMLYDAEISLLAIYIHLS